MDVHPPHSPIHFLAIIFQLGPPHPFFVRVSLGSSPNHFQLDHNHFFNFQLNSNPPPGVLAPQKPRGPPLVHNSPPCVAQDRDPRPPPDKASGRGKPVVLILIECDTHGCRIRTIIYTHPFSFSFMGVVWMGPFRTYHFPFTPVITKGSAEHIRYFCLL